MRGALYGEVLHEKEKATTEQGEGIVVHDCRHGSGEPTTEDAARGILPVTGATGSTTAPEEAPSEYALEDISYGSTSRGGVHRGVPLGNFTITFYTAGPESTGKDIGDEDYGITAIGSTAVEGRTIAADWCVLPPRSIVYIDGVGTRYVEDRGGAIKGKRIDVFMDDHKQALQCGKVSRKVYLIRRGAE